MLKHLLAHVKLIVWQIMKNKTNKRKNNNNKKKSKYSKYIKTLLKGIF